MTRPDLKIEDGGAATVVQESGDEHVTPSEQELATRLYVACTSFMMGNKGLDNFRRTYVTEGEPMGDYWVRMARHVFHTMHGA